ncbi:MAG: Fe-S cluster assembly ATPase SufC [Fibrobacterota bacterium]|jgi:Fe-S cluster assembly ATP-binding protein
MSGDILLEIKGLRATAGKTEIIKGLDLVVRRGETHAIMGPNGAGKSTLSQVIAGHPGYTITEGEILLNGKNMLEMEPEIRSREGVFVAFQYPVEIPGLANNYFLRTALNEHRKYKGLPELDGGAFLKLVKEKMKLVHMDPALISRSLNDGFSGGQKKRNEVLQMLLLEPEFALLDETDSGLDIDALRDCAEGVNTLRSPERGFVVVTHYQRLLDYIQPDFVHVLYKGRIIHSGGKELALELEEKGYEWLTAGVQ